MRVGEIKIASIDAVDREIEGGFPLLRFAPDLECVYEEHTRHHRDRYFIATGQLATILYNLFLISDWLMTPDVFKQALIVRTGIFTPYFLATWFVISRGPPPWVRESIACFTMIVSVILPMAVLTMSRGPDLAVYQYGTVLIMLFTAVVQRQRSRYVAVTLISILVIQLTTAAHLHGITPGLMGNVVVFFLTAGVLLLWAAMTLEREERRSYLLDLRSRILNDHLDRISKQDALTGLWNRRHLETVMDLAWTDAEAAPRPMSVILLDIDHFKMFNDSYGHLEGDKCLRQVGACVRASIDGDTRITAVRFGGEEFLLFVDGADTDAARTVADRIRAAIKAAAIPHPALAYGACVTASFGIATGRAPEQAKSRLVAVADEALYRSKHAGRDRVRSIVIGVEELPTPRQARLPLAC